MKATDIKPTPLFNIEVWYRDSITGTARRVSTVEYGKPYALAKSIKRQEDLKNHPKGTFTKLVKHG